MSQVLMIKIIKNNDTHPPFVFWGGTQIRFRQGCAAQDSKPIVAERDTQI